MGMRESTCLPLVPHFFSAFLAFLGLSVPQGQPPRDVPACTHAVDANAPTLPHLPTRSICLALRAWLLAPNRDVPRHAASPGPLATSGPDHADASAPQAAPGPFRLPRSDPRAAT